ncbi:membrane-spanning 4-domains subfamily A member 8-like isoform X2 [Myotis daubentonii]|uniref:membrane-spanning 4-domains subfamily A member 8-like isoform X2 n=1 Tax=Myotis daubentonii TaxID=98922 RepID=UPI002872DC44|nr:membrane-spanning 4-domains subfamily A member 8-like isoform X2 [Myotis daubentonii]
MNLMTSEGPTANSVFVMASHNGYPVNPGSMSQVPLYPLNQPQVHQISGNQPGLEPPVSMQPTGRSLKEAKVLGAIQILIGLVHIGLGSVLGTIVLWYYTALSFYGGYPFWGGILVSNFIISGSLSVTSEQLPRSSCLLKGSMGLSITSAIVSLVGIMLLITDMIINNLHSSFSSYPCSGVVSGVTTSAVLFIFSLLEFCIACTSAHFGCKLFRYSHNNGTVVFQTVYVTNPVANPEPVNSPPSYSSEIQDSK